MFWGGGEDERNRAQRSRRSLRKGEGLGGLANDWVFIRVAGLEFLRKLAPAEAESGQ